MIEQMSRILAATPAEKISNAFERGAGVPAENVSYLIAGVAAVAVMLWAAWVIVSDYEGFARGEVSFYDLLWHLVRVSIVVMLFIIFVSPK